MSPEMRKLAVQGMVTVIRNRTLALIRNYHKIRENIEIIKQKTPDLNDPIWPAVQSVVIELDNSDHIGKLTKLHKGVAQLLSDVTATDPEEDFSKFIGQLAEIEKEISQHFSETIPNLYEKFNAARRNIAELN